jgi:hypothetical protein
LIALDTRVRTCATPSFMGFLDRAPFSGVIA